MEISQVEKKKKKNPSIVFFLSVAVYRSYYIAKRLIRENKELRCIKEITELLRQKQCGDVITGEVFWRLRRSRARTSSRELLCTNLHHGNISNIWKEPKWACLSQWVIDPICFARICLFVFIITLQLALVAAAQRSRKRLRLYVCQVLFPKRRIIELSSMGLGLNSTSLASRAAVMSTDKWKQIHKLDFNSSLFCISETFPFVIGFFFLWEREREKVTKWVKKNPIRSRTHDAHVLLNTHHVFTGTSDFTSSF